VQRLVEGIHHFRAHYFAENQSLFEHLARDGQNPETLFITCSDSRVVPTLITSAAPGELFIVRNVGNIVPSVSRGMIGGVAAAIEYAVEVLDVENIVICGHTQCGAIDAILDPSRVQHLGFVSRWLRESEAIPNLLRDKYAHLIGEERLVAAAEENVLVQLENLRSYPFVSSRLDAGTLKVAGWVFKIATAQVFGYDPVAEQFVAFARSAGPP
jgi:carbonic anhydrase